MTRPLFTRWPRLLESAPIIELGEFPTPVVRAEKLGKAWGLDLWIKRDDIAAASFGGNKVRKLEFLLADAQKRADRIWAYAVTGSNWAVAVAHYAKRIGLPVDLTLFKRPMNPYLEGNLALAKKLARRVTVSRTVMSVPFGGLIQKLTSGRSYLMPPGGSNALSSLGYINAGLELADQIQQEALPPPDVVLAPLGTGGTLAGIVAGLRLAGLKTEVIGVRVSDFIVSNPFLTARTARRATALLARRAGDPAAALPFRARDFRILHNYIGRGYGIPTDAGGDAASALEDHEGLRAESTYTAKALAALRDLAPSLKGRRVLFWLTCNSRPLGGMET